MKLTDITIKATSYAEFLILHLGLDDAYLYVDILKKHVEAKSELFKSISEESIANFYEIKSNGKS